MRLIGEAQYRGSPTVVKESEPSGEEWSPSTIVLSPDRWREAELSCDRWSVPYGAGRPGRPVDSAAQRVWGVGVFVTNGTGNDTAIVGDLKSACRRVRETPRIDWFRERLRRLQQKLAPISL